MREPTVMNVQVGCSGCRTVILKRRENEDDNEEGKIIN